MRGEFRGDFNKVSVGDVIMLDDSVFECRTEGEVVHIAQQGDQNDRSEFESQRDEKGFGDLHNLSGKIFAITSFYPEEDMRSNRDLRGEGRDAEYGQFIGQEVIKNSETGYSFKEDGSFISFNQGPHDLRGGFDAFDRTFNFPQPRLATVQFEEVKTITGFTPA